MVDKLIEDDSYAAFAFEIDPALPCRKYQSCEVVAAPFTEGRSAGGVGWFFPKRSPFLSIFNKYYWELQEEGHFARIKGEPEYHPFKLLPDQECETLDGHPISMHKVISLFTMFVCSAFLSSTIFW